MKLFLNLQTLYSSKNQPSKAQFQQWVAMALKQAQYSLSPVSLTLRLVDLEENHPLNHQYKKKNKPTNVLAFPALMIPGHQENYLGDIVICAPIVEKEAQEQNISTEAHWAHLIIHGTLHLLGFDHEEDQDAEKMEELEIRILENLNYPNPYSAPEK